MILNEIRMLNKIDIHALTQQLFEEYDDEVRLQRSRKRHATLHGGLLVTNSNEETELVGMIPSSKLNLNSERSKTLESYPLTKIPIKAPPLQSSIPIEPPLPLQTEPEVKTPDQNKKTHRKLELKERSPSSQQKKEMKKIGKKERSTIKRKQSQATNITIPYEDPFATLEISDSPLRDLIGKLLYNDSFPLTSKLDYLSSQVNSRASNLRQPVEQISFINAKLFSEEGTQAYGAPVAMAHVPKKALITGTNAGQICYFDLSKKELSLTLQNKKDPTVAVTALDISSDLEILVVCYANGNIERWNLTTKTSEYLVENAVSGRVLCCRLWMGKESIICSDTEGGVTTIQFKKGFFGWSVDIQKVFYRTAGFVANIEILRKEKDFNHRTNEFQIAAMASTTMVIIVALHPELGVISRFKRPEYITERSISPSLSWGRGAVPSELENIDPVISIGWGKHVLLSKLTHVTFESVDKTKDPNQYKRMEIAGHLVGEHEILVLTWISYNLLFCLDSEFTISIMNSGNLFPHEYDPRFETNMNHSLLLKATIVSKIPLGIMELPVQIFGADSSVQSYGACYVVDSINNSLLMCSSNSVHIYKLVTWVYYIDELVRSRQWKDAMVLLLEIEKGRNKMFASEQLLTAKDLRDLVLLKSHVIILDYLNPYQLTHPMENGTDLSAEQEAEWKERLLTSLDLLAALGDYRFLFGDELMKFCELFGQMKYFWQCLEPFILNRKIKWLPPEILRRMADFYRDKGKLHIIEFLLLQLKFESGNEAPIEVDSTIRICIDFRMFLALINICVKCEEDFITPLVMLFSIYRKSLDEKKPDREVAQIGLVYLKNCIRGIFYPAEEFPERLHNMVIQRLAEWLASRTNFEMLIEIDFHIGISLLLMMILVEPASTYLSSSDGLDLPEAAISFTKLKEPQYFRRSSSLKETQGGKDISESVYSLQNNLTRFIDLILNNVDIFSLFTEPTNEIKEVSQEFKQRRWSMIYFIQKIIESNLFVLRADLCFRIAFFILQNYSSTNSQTYVASLQEDPESSGMVTVSTNENPKLDLSKNDGNKRHLYSKEEPFYMKHWSVEQQIYFLETNLIKLLRHSSASMPSADINKLAHVAGLTPFAEVYAFLMWMVGDYKKGIDIYLDAQDYFDQERVFDFVEDMLRIMLSKPGEREKMNEVLKHILMKLEKFVQISSERTQKIISHFSKESEKKVVMSLNQQPELQLEYLDRMLQDLDREVRVDDDILLLHVKLLCIYRPKQFIHELKDFNYPLTDSLKICRDKNCLQGEAYFLEKISDYHNAMRIHLKILDRRIDKLTEHLEYGEPNGTFPVL